jgi:protein-L-isoaspartate(D-aspartate) O-methyltransferase
MPDLTASRQRMLDVQLARRGISDAHVLDAMASVPREVFVNPGFEEFAYEDNPLPIGEGQTISQPYIVAFMLEAAEIAPGDRALEVGAGSGYLAAVMGRIASYVYAIERLPNLALAARHRIERLGLKNVQIFVGDGTRGLDEAAPFDVIIVSAGGPAVPSTLKEQLALNGRLVIPVDANGHQNLQRITRRSETEYDSETLAPVAFVPLIGEQGWAEDGRRAASNHTPGHARNKSAPDLIAEAAEPLDALEDAGFAAPFSRFKDARVVLLGEATHGTSEFYRARAAITRRLIERHGFTIVAVEADWPDAAAVDRYVRHRASTGRPEPPFQRFPTWMWRNTEVVALIDWMQAHNSALPAERRAGFHGLDMYNMSGSIAQVLAYLDDVDPATAAVARERYGCLTPWQKDPASYGRAVLNDMYRDCEDAVVAQCRELLQKRVQYEAADPEGWLDAAQNARLVASAEEYYRIMYYGGPESWNLRDRHMFDTFELLLEARGPDAKAIVWAHNSHIGDARHTEMGSLREELNVGQLCRQRFGDDAALIGFGMDTGTVAAASDWGGDMEVTNVRRALPGSYERLCRESGVPRFLLDLRANAQPALRRALLPQKLERFIGVIYRPESERMSHYMQCSLPQQFDAYVWFDTTSAVTPLGPQHARPGAPETYPFGF